MTDNTLNAASAFANESFKNILNWTNPKGMLDDYFRKDKKSSETVVHPKTALDELADIMTKPGRYVKKTQEELTASKKATEANDVDFTANPLGYFTSRIDNVLQSPYKDVNMSIDSDINKVYESAKTNASIYKQQKAIENKDNIGAQTQDTMGDILNKAATFGKSYIGGRVIGAAMPGVLALDAVEGLVNKGKKPTEKSNVIDSTKSYETMVKINKIWATGGNITDANDAVAQAGDLAGEFNINPVSAGTFTARILQGGGRLLAGKNMVGEIAPIISHLEKNPVIAEAVENSPEMAKKTGDLLGNVSKYFGEVAQRGFVGGAGKITGNLAEGAGNVIDSVSKFADSGFEASSNGILKYAVNPLMAATTGLGAGSVGRAIDHADIINSIISNAVSSSMRLPLLGGVMNLAGKTGAGIGEFIGKTKTAKDIGEFTGKAISDFSIEHPKITKAITKTAQAGAKIVPGITEAGVKTAIGGASGYAAGATMSGDWDITHQGANIALGAGIGMTGSKAIPNMIEAMLVKSPTAKNLFRYATSMANPTTIEALISHTEPGYRAINKIKEMNGLATLDDLHDYQAVFPTADGGTITYEGWLTNKIQSTNIEGAKSGVNTIKFNSFKNNISKKSVAANEANIAKIDAKIVEAMKVKGEEGMQKLAELTTEREALQARKTQFERDIQDSKDELVKTRLTRKPYKTLADMPEAELAKYLKSPKLSPSEFAEEVIKTLEKEAGDIPGVYRLALRDQILLNCEHHTVPIYENMGAASATDKTPYAYAPLEKAQAQANNFKAQVNEGLYAMKNGGNLDNIATVLGSLDMGVSNYEKTVQKLYSNTQRNHIEATIVGGSVEKASGRIATLHEVLKAKTDLMKQTLSETLDSVNTHAESHPEQAPLLNDVKTYLQENISKIEKLDPHSSKSNILHDTISTIGQLSLGYKNELSQYSDALMVQRNYATAIEETKRNFLNSMTPERMAAAKANAHSVKVEGPISKFRSAISVNTPKDLVAVRDMLVNDTANPVRAYMKDHVYTPTSADKFRDGLQAELGKGFIKSQIYRQNLIDMVVLPDAIRIVREAGIEEGTVLFRKAVFNVSREALRNTGLIGQHGSYGVFMGADNAEKIKKLDLGLAFDVLNGLVSSSVKETVRTKNPDEIMKLVSKLAGYQNSWVKGQYRGSQLSNQVIESVITKASKNGIASITTHDINALGIAVQSNLARSILFGITKGSGIGWTQYEADITDSFKGFNNADSGETFADKALNWVTERLSDDTIQIKNRIKMLAQSDTPKAIKEMEALNKILEKKVALKADALKWGLYGQSTGRTHAAQTSIPLLMNLKGAEILVSTVVGLVSKDIKLLGPGWQKNMLEFIASRGVSHSRQGTQFNELQTGESPAGGESAAYATYSKDPLTNTSQETVKKQYDRLKSELQYIPTEELLNRLMTLDTDKPDPVMKEYIDIFTKDTKKGSPAYDAGFDKALEELDKLASKNPKTGIAPSEDGVNQVVNKINTEILAGYEKGIYSAEEVINELANSGIMEADDITKLKIYGYAYYNDPKLLKILNEIDIVSDINLPDSQAEQILASIEEDYNKNAGMGNKIAEGIKPLYTPEYAEKIAPTAQPAPAQFTGQMNLMEGIPPAAQNEAVEKINYYLSKGFSIEESRDMVRRQLKQ